MLGQGGGWRVEGLNQDSSGLSALYQSINVVFRQHAIISHDILAFGRSNHFPTVSLTSATLAADLACAAGFLTIG